MLPLFSHEKRTTVPGSLHGIINQVNKSMFHAFVNAFETNKDFYTTTEDTALGDFDDAVIITEDGKITAIQYKHSLNPNAAKPINMNNLVTQGGSDKELMLHSYYKSVVNKNVNLDNPNLTLILATNVKLNENELGCCLDQQKKCFNSDFFREAISEASFRRRIIIASILKHNNKLNADGTNILFVFTHIKYVLAQDMSYDHLHKLWQAFKPAGTGRYTDEQKKRLIIEFINAVETGTRIFTNQQWLILETNFLKQPVWPDSQITHYDVIFADCHPEKAQVINFLKRLQIAHSEASCSDTVKDIKRKLLDKFQQGEDAAEILYQAFFNYFLEWLGSYEAKKITSAEIKSLFEQWVQRYIMLQRWIGVSMAYRQSLITTIRGISISQTDLHQRISEFEQSTQQMLVLYGDRGLGKSTTVCQFIQSHKRYDSDYLLLEINTILKTMTEMKISFKDCRACKVLFLDNCEDLLKQPYDTKQLELFLQETTVAGIKIVLLYRAQKSLFDRLNSLLGFPKANITFIDMPTFKKETVIKTFPQIFGIFQPQSLTLFKRSVPVPLQPLVCHPFYLNLLIKYHETHHHFNINFSSTENFVELVLESLLNKNQINICRSLVCNLSKAHNASLKSTDPDVISLIEQGILIVRDSQYNFSHKLYEEWSIRLVLTHRLTSMLETEDSIREIYQTCVQILPRHLNEVYVFLGEHQGLSVYCRKKTIKEDMHLGAFNSNTYFYKILIKEKDIHLILQHRLILLIQPDLDPVGALTLLLMLVKNIDIHSLLNNKEIFFSNTFYECLVRALCLSPDLKKTHALFCEILQELDKKSPSGKLLDYYLEKVFYDIFTSTNSVGLMGLDAKLEFLTGVMRLTSPLSYYRYYSYIYQGLLKAANPFIHGEARTYDRYCYFTNGDAYIDYKGNCYSLAGEDSEENIRAYHYAAIRLLLLCYQWDKQLGRDIQLPDIISIFEENLEYLNCNECEVATIIAAEIDLDDLRQETLNELETALDKFPTELSDKVRKILDWRKKHANSIYKLEVAPLIDDDNSDEDTETIAQRHGTPTSTMSP